MVVGQTQSTRPIHRTQNNLENKQSLSRYKFNRKLGFDTMQMLSVDNVVILEITL